MRVADVRATASRTVARVRAVVYRILDTVPPVRRTVDELVRIEVVDRAMIIGAQGLLALVPMLVVLAAFLPDEALALAAERFQDVLGITGGSQDVVEESLSSVESTGGTGVDQEQVRTTTGIVGILIILFSATSFSRAIQRMYERVWEQRHRGGVIGRRRCLSWLLAWLVMMQLISGISWLENRVDQPVLEPLWFVLKAVVSTLIWWWSMRVLLFSRVAWTALFVPAVATGVAVTIYAGGSSLVMPTYVASSANQFGTLGLVLAVATWLVGFAGVLVVTATVGRVVSEDQGLRRVAGRLATRPRSWRAAPRGGAPGPPPAAGSA